jgi:hypothetical protein
MRWLIASIVAVLSIAGCSATNGTSSPDAAANPDADCYGLPPNCGDPTKCPWPQPLCFEGNWKCVAATIECDAGDAQDSDVDAGDGHPNVEAGTTVDGSVPDATDGSFPDDALDEGGSAG